MGRAAALGAILALSPLLVSLSPLAPVPPPVRAEQRGIAMGAKIPAFQAVDQRGRSRSFDSLVGPSGLVILFVRSADW